jgi:IclR helix-turn-helix domain
MPLAVTDLLERVRAELAGRLDQLRPAVDEHARLQAAATALGEPARSQQRRARPARAVAGRTRARPKATARDGRGRRASQIVEAVAAEPGLGSSAIADRLNMNRTYTSQLVSRLVRDGHLDRRGRKLYPKTNAA